MLGDRANTVGEPLSLDIAEGGMSLMRSIASSSVEPGSSCSGANRTALLLRTTRANAGRCLCMNNMIASFLPVPGIGNIVGSILPAAGPPRYRGHS